MSRFVDWRLSAERHHLALLVPTWTRFACANAHDRYTDWRKNICRMISEPPIYEAVST
jgi:hypothetical protein